MLQAPWRICKYLFRTAWKACKWPLLLTLPVTILPIIGGIIGGFYFPYWNHSLVSGNVDAFLQDVKDQSNDWGVPGAMSFRQFQDINNGFHVLRLNSDDWASKLGFVLPLAYGDWKYFVDTPVNKFGSLDSLMLDSTCSTGTTPPKEQWVYLSDFGWPGLSDWDTAFSAVVQAAYVPSALNETRLFFAMCHGTAKFLCGVWSVKPPALLHFKVEDHPPRREDLDPGVQYPTNLWNLRPVTVRVIEFPLKDTYTGLASDVFPGPEEQMLAITRGDRLYEQFEEWDEMRQMMLRFQDSISAHYDRKGSFLYYLGKADTWVERNLANPLGVKDLMDFTHITCFLLVAGVINGLILPPWIFLKETIMDYLGYPRRGDRVLGDAVEKPAWNEPFDLLAGLIPAFWEDASKNIKSMSVESEWRESKITTSPILEGIPSAELPVVTA